MNQKLFSINFTLVVIGQIISLFGNATVRFALPLYLLNLTGSSTLYGAVTACAFIPAILLSPLGGIIADRVNKRNIMMILDFFTAAVIITFSLLMNGVNLIFLLTLTLMLLYGIAGAYQPSVQASIPALTSQDHFMAANSIINTVSSFASLIGPALGGVLYSAYGLKPVLWICAACFTLSAMIIVALPYLITEVLNLEASQANRLYGFAEGALAAGGLVGGIGAGIFANKLQLHKSGSLIVSCAVCVFPISAALMLISSGIINYIIITACCFVIMIFSTVFTVQMMSLIQTETPQNLIGKVIAVILTVSMCAQPLGNTLYGVLFEVCKGYEYAVVLFSGIVSLAIALCAKKQFISA